MLCLRLSEPGAKNWVWHEDVVTSSRSWPSVTRSTDCHSFLTKSIPPRQISTTWRTWSTETRSGSSWWKTALFAASFPTREENTRSLRHRACSTNRACQRLCSSLSVHDLGQSTTLMARLDSGPSPWSVQPREATSELAQSSAKQWF